MTMVKIIADSISPQGIRLPTLHLRYWRAIHAELMTHRVFSRNARSSRAVPSKVLLTEPIYTPQFGMNKPGMQSDILAPANMQKKWASEWEELSRLCRDYVKHWSSEGMHKQHANRPLEWFGWIDVLVTSTDWENFFALRVSEYAQPEFDELARAMREALHCSTPKLLQPGEWHLPYVTDEEQDGRWGINSLLMLSTARCARLSYEPFEEGKFNLNDEIARYEKLVVNQPVHASPAEHQATPDRWSSNQIDGYRWSHPELHGNFRGWIQHRKTLANESVRD